MKRLIILITALAVGFLAAPQPAEAGTYSGGSLTLTTHDLAMWPDDCDYARYSVTAPTSDFVSWTADINIYDPNGALVGSDFFYPSVTSGTTVLCGDAVPGRYRVIATYESQDFTPGGTDPVEHQTITGYFTFTRRAKQTSSLTMTKTRLGAHKWKIVGRLTKAGRAWSGHRVQIQAYGPSWGGWGVLKGKTTNRNGQVTFTSRPKRGAGKIPIRLHSTGGSYVRDANSHTFRLKPR